MVKKHKLLLVFQLFTFLSFGQNQVVQLKDVVVGSENIQSILKNINDKLNDETLYIFNWSHRKEYSSLKADNKYYFYFNEKIKFIPESKRLFRTQQNKTINKIQWENTTDKNLAVYNYADSTLKRYYISVNNEKIPMLGYTYGIHFNPLENNEILKQFLTKNKNWNYKLDKDENHYRIAITPKNKKPFQYQGILLVDRNDYGIYSFVYELVTDKKNIKKVKAIHSDKMKTFAIHSVVSEYFLKKEKEQYIVISKSLKMNYALLEKNKTIHFEKEQISTSVPPFEDSNLKEFDWFKDLRLEHYY